MSVRIFVMRLDFPFAAAARRLLHGSLACLLLAAAGPAAAHDSLTGVRASPGTAAGST